MLNNLLLIFIPMILGYMLLIPSSIWLKRINTFIGALLYVILFVIGISLGQVPNLSSQIPFIGTTVVVFIVAILSCNILGLMAYDKLAPTAPLKEQHIKQSHMGLILQTIVLISMVILGFLVGWISRDFWVLPSGASNTVLILMLFGVGIQLRNSGIHMREVVFNQRGLITGLIFTITSLLGGFIAALLLNLPISQGLAVASGFGWYSLSSVVLNSAWGAIWGSIAFLNDLSRELMSIFLIPFFMPKCRSTAVGFPGATAIDCTLPLIQKAGGMEVVPFAISFGFITNILPPILLSFFSSIPLH